MTLSLETGASPISEKLARFESPVGELQLSERVKALHQEVLTAPLELCAERAFLVTEYFRRLADRRQPMVLQKAGALAHVLQNKRVAIYPRELLVGCFTSHRVGGGLFPELHGVAVLEDLFRFDKRKTNRFVVSPRDRWRLFREVLPYWLPRFLAIRAFPKLRALRFVFEQMTSLAYVINETGGISHFVPDYVGLVTRGTDGYRQEVKQRLAEMAPASEGAQFLHAVERVCDGLDSFAARFVAEAERLAAAEADPERRLELQRIAATCARVPRHPAQSFQEALQSILFAQIALNLESLDNSVCPGRLDQILHPYYEADVQAGRITPAGAFELLGCFAVKLCEAVPLFSKRITRLHGGLFNGQVVVVGGTDGAGRDATNEVTYLFLELMDQLRTRQPNYHARLHASSPPEYRRRIASALAAGAVSPALYNDEVIVPILRARGVSEEDARDYANVGCVEPVPAGKAFFSTDAALFNLPLCLELALNEGRRFGKRRRLGIATPPAADCTDIEDFFALLAQQVEHLLGRLLVDLGAIEKANARWHPTPLTSMLLRGCLETARDTTVGGAKYDGSGVQGVGVVEMGDSLAAIEEVVFRQCRASMAELVAACKADFRGAESLRARLRSAPKYGNDIPEADRWVARVMHLFADFLEARVNTRGGRYAAGFYSVTAHQAFGEVVGALPNGRAAGEPFSSGLSPTSGADRLGPTAALSSAAHLPLDRAGNGVNFNLQLSPLAGATVPGLVQGLIEGGFAAGCMQMQINVLDPRVLIEARDHPGRYPGLLVRVSGYSAYFDDLTPEMKQEIIERSFFDLGPAADSSPSRLL